MITAYTAPGSFYPPYINASLADDGFVRVIVRSKATDDGKSGAVAEISLPRDEFERMFGPLVDAIRS